MLNRKAKFDMRTAKFIRYFIYTQKGRITQGVKDEELGRLYVAVDKEGVYFISWKVECKDGMFFHPRTGYKTPHSIEEIEELSKVWGMDCSAPTGVFKLDSIRREVTKDFLIEFINPVKS